MRLWTFMRALLILVGVSLLPAAGSAADPPRTVPPAAARKVDFAADIQPLLARHCYSCHGADKQESSFRLDRKQESLKGGDFGEKPILPGRGEESPLVRYIAGVGDIDMPPKGPRLSAEEVGLFRAWIDQGASWPDDADSSLKLTTKHWSFQPLKPVAVPDVKHAHATGNPIDAFVAARLLDAGLTPSPAADRTTLLRRLYLEMLGLPPSPSEIQAFAQDQQPDAYAKRVEQVLASPRYGERWARHWLDVVRFAETNGFETNVERPNAWHYRDYVIEALNNDKPYDQFVFEQLAGDAVGVDAATGFLVGGPWDQVKSPDPVLTAMQRSDELADMTNTTATAFLGLTVGCARCHNHKFDPILQKDYYALQAVFAGVQHGERPMTRPQSPDHQQFVREKQERLAKVKAELAGLRPTGRRGRTLLLDDETLLASAQGSGVTLLAKKAGHGINPDGADRGRKDDPGDFDRSPNVSRGRYTWWANKAGEDVLAYRPALEGRHRIWLSWGCGFATHTQDAQYILDADGDIATKEDQTIVAKVDQQQLAASKEQLASQPLWSGFVSAGVHELKGASVLLVRGGKTGTAITADVVAFEELVESAVADQDSTPPAQPPLRVAVNSRENIESLSPVAARYVRFTSLATNSGLEPCLDELEIYSVAAEDRPARNVALATNGARLSSSGNYQGNPAHRLEHLNDGKYGNSFSWISNTAGTGWVQIELPETTTIDRIVWGRDRDEQYSDRTATSYLIEVATEPDKWQTVVSSADRLPYDAGKTTAEHLQYLGLSGKDAAKAKSLLVIARQLEGELKSLTTSQMVYAGRFNTPRPTHRLYRGDPMQPREVVAPDCLTVLGTLGLSTDAAEQQRRVALAKWIADPSNPLTARVIVNRVWQHHFGTGIVDTPSDLGVNGARPSHPELLDWLAQEFMKRGWSLKELHRLILTSNTYQQSNQPHERGMQVDAQCRLLWRYPPHRLEAESIRDAILATSGALDLQMGGPGWSTFKPNANYVRVYDPKEEFGPAEWRRAIYMTKVRMRQDGVFGTFDCPDGGQIAPKRARSTTALQALSLFNSQFILKQAELFAVRAERDAGPAKADQVLRTFELALGRRPDAEEARSALALVEEHGLAALCRALFNANEFLFIP